MGTVEHHLKGNAHTDRQSTVQESRNAWVLKALFKDARVMTTWRWGWGRGGGGGEVSRGGEEIILEPERDKEIMPGCHATKKKKKKKATTTTTTTKIMIGCERGNELCKKANVAKYFAGT